MDYSLGVSGFNTTPFGQPNGPNSPAAPTTSSWASGLQGITGIFGALDSFAGGLSKSTAYGIQADYQERVASVNSAIADMQADQAIQKGEKASQLYLSGIRQKIGAQRSGYAAQGVDVNLGTAANVQEQTKFFGALDAQTIKNNAYTTAFGYRMQAIGATAAGQYAGISGELNSQSSLVAGGLSGISDLAKTAYSYFGK